MPTCSSPPWPGTRRALVPRRPPRARPCRAARRGSEAIVRETYLDLLRRELACWREVRLPAEEASGCSLAAGHSPGLIARPYCADRPCPAVSARSAPGPGRCGRPGPAGSGPVSYTHLTLPTNREV